MIFSKLEARVERREQRPATARSDRSASSAGRSAWWLVLALAGLLALLVAYFTVRRGIELDRRIQAAWTPGESGPVTLGPAQELPAETEPISVLAGPEPPRDPEGPPVTPPDIPLGSGPALVPGWIPGQPLPPELREALGEWAAVADAAKQAQDLLGAGRLADAARTFELAVRAQPGVERVPAVRLLQANLHLRAGRDFLQRGLTSNARDSFALGLTAMPESADLHAGAAKVDLGLGQYSRALAHVREALRLDPGRQDLHAVATWLAWRLDDVDGARESAERFTRAHPESPTARRLQAQMTREAAVEGDRRREGRHFIVRYQGPADRRAADLVLDILEDARQRLWRELRIRPRESLVALLYTEQQFLGVTGAPGWAGGAYDGKIRLPTGGISGSTAHLADTVTHEYVHALIHSVAGRNCPRWLHEGLAQYFEPGEPGSRIGRKLHGLRLLPLRALGPALQSPDPRLAKLAYLQCLALVAYVMDTRGKRDVLVALRRMGEGEPPATAIKRVWGGRAEEIAAKAWKHFQGG